MSKPKQDILTKIGVYTMKSFLKKSLVVRRHAARLSVILCVAMLSGCSNTDESQPNEISVASAESAVSSPFPAKSCGVTLEKAPEKIVSLSPAVTEVICELGFKEKLVGISDYCDYPEGLSAQKVGSTENPNIDEIIKLKPDAVFTLSELSEREAYTLSQANIAVLTAEPPKNMEGYSALYKEIAAAFYGKEKLSGEKETEKAVQAGADARSALEKAAGSVRLESFVYVTEKLTIAGSDTFENAVFSLSGKNVCKEQGYVSADKAETAPKYIIADNSLTLDALYSSETLNGFMQGGAEVRFVDAIVFERPTARTLSVFKELAEENAASADRENV